jgi:hypothetical protein
MPLHEQTHTLLFLTSAEHHVYEIHIVEHASY